MPRHTAALLCSFLVLLLTSWAFGQAKFVLYSPTPSLAKGFYRLTREAPAIGGIISFPLPTRIHPYISQRMGKPMRDDWRLLKPIIAGESDLVCVSDDGFSLNGRRIAGVQLADSLGNPAPVWRECRRLEAGEFFVYSGYHERSLDSRYVGPVRAEEIQGVYTPLWTWEN